MFLGAPRTRKNRFFKTHRCSGFQPGIRNPRAITVCGYPLGLFDDIRRYSTTQILEKNLHTWSRKPRSRPKGWLCSRSVVSFRIASCSSLALVRVLHGRATVRVFQGRANDLAAQSPGLLVTRLAKGLWWKGGVGDKGWLAKRGGR